MAIEAKVHHEEITTTEVVTEVNMVEEIKDIQILATETGASEESTKVEIETVREEDRGGDQIEGPTKIEDITMTTTDLTQMLKVVRYLLLLQSPLWMMQELITSTQTGMTGERTMALTSMGKITFGALRMTLHTTPRSESLTTGKPTTVASVRPRLRSMSSHKREPKLIQNLEGRNE